MSTIAVLERNRVVGQRIARVMCAAGRLAEVPTVDEPVKLHSLFSARPKVLGCDALHLDEARGLLAKYPTLHLIVWTADEVNRVLSLAQEEPRISSIIGWPSFESMPRPWEIALGVARVLEPSGTRPRLADLLGWGATIIKWRPQTSRERDQAVSEVVRWSCRAGASARTAERMGELAHELLMNAMYDAPLDRDRIPRYSHDRKQDIVLDEAEVPTLRLGTDGVHIALQVIDPFGALRRHHVFEGILRGMSAKTSGEPAAVLDTSGGGAGLGMIKIYSAGAVLIVDVEQNAETCVTSFYDLDVNPREQRSLPISLHFFEAPPRRPS
jgi:hypothetical protein